MKKLILSSFALVAFVLMTNSASAQTSSLAVTIPTVMTLTAANSAALDFTFTAAELTAGKELTNAVTLNYISNKRTFVSISATEFTATGGFTMPASIVQFKTDAVGDAFAEGKVLTAEDQVLSGVSDIGGGEVGNVRGNKNILVSYKLTPTLNYEPAAYSSTVTYTITAN
jgi:hypothetical protein